MVAAAKRRPLRTYRSERPFSHLLRAVFGVSGGLSLIHASAAMPIVDATAIGLLYVVFVIPLGVLVLKETVGLRHGVGIALCCLDAAVVVGSRGVFTSFEPAYLRPAGIAVVGAALLAIEGLMIRVLANADRPLTVLLHVNVFGIFLMAVPAALAWQPISVANATPFLLLGPIVVMAQYCIVRGYALASLAVVGPVDALWLVFAALIGFVVFGEVPTIGVVLGSLAIAGGGAVLALADPVSRTDVAS